MDWIGSVRRVVSWASGKYNKLFRPAEWNIGIVHAPIHAFLELGFEPEIHWLPAPTSGKFVADPFGLQVDGRLYLLYEEFDFETNRGSIASIMLENDRFVSKPEVVLNPSFHVSYPYLVHHEGSLYFIPEAAAIREVAIYKADNETGRWSKFKTLLSDIAAVDTTIFQHNDRWWMMFTDKDLGSNRALCIYHAPGLFGPWTAHTRNPVKDDNTSSRPAGKPFVHDGTLYRPAQDCSRTYGGAVVINRLDRLTPDEFRETTVASVQPDRSGPYPDGIHTLSAAGDITILDGKRHVFIKKALTSALAEKVKFVFSHKR